MPLYHAARSQVVITAGLKNQAFPEVALGPDGSMVAVWTDESLGANQFDVRAEIFSTAGVSAR